MTERRQATRTTPISVPVASASSGEVLVAPLAWRARIDLGKLIVQCYEDAVNQLTSIGMEAAKDKVLHIPLLEDLMDYDRILVAMGIDVTATEVATWEELMAIFLTSCEVNGLGNLYYMLDPNAQSPSQNREAGKEASDGPKTSPSEDSSVPESASTMSSD